MKLSMLKAIPSYRDVLSVFGGYNHNLRIGEGEFYDMKNLSSAKYPVLSPRGKRGKFVFPSDILAPNISGMLVKGDDLYYVHNNKLYKNDKDNDTVLFEFEESYDKRTLVSMGAYIIIMPDKVYVNTADSADSACKPLDYVAEIEDDKRNNTAENDKYDVVWLDFRPSDLNGVDINPTISDKPPEDFKPLDYWLDTSVIPGILKQYDGSRSEWVLASSRYVRILASIQFNDGGVVRRKAVFENFNVGDNVTVSSINAQWLTTINSDIDYALSGNAKDQVIALCANSLRILSKNRESIVVEAPLDIGMRVDLKGTTNVIKVSREAPEMDFVIESGNRLWGCKYGTVDNALVNEIYASKLGDPTNWQSFAGLASDSYAVTVGSDGAFTGAITYMGVPIFFKENCIHKVYGNFPSNFQIQDTACRGVQSGCAESLVIVNETLFYKSRTAVCAYDGSFPTEVSAALGDKVYDNAAAGALGNKYYISMRDVDSVTGEYSLFVLDTAKGMWHKEDRTQATKFVTRRNNLYYLDYASKHIKMVHSESNADPEMDAISWEAVTGIIGVDTPGKKYISGLEFRIRLALDSIVRIYAEYDSCGEWEQLYVKTGDKLSSTVIPLRPKRCDHLRLKIVGTGEAELYSITKTITNGGT